MNIITIIILYLGISAISFLFNGIRMFKMKRYLDNYFEWLMSGKSKLDLAEHQHQVKTLVERAGKGGLTIPVAQEMGYGRLATFQADPFLGFPNRLESVAQVTVSILKSCIGIYRSRMWSSFNPLYWLSFILLLPKHLLVYMGVNGDKIVVKIFNIAWWAFSSLVTVVLLRENAKRINDFVISFLK